jgi:DNA-directed RNA polymerase specialized sigma24 family protein
LSRITQTVADDFKVNDHVHVAFQKAYQKLDQFRDAARLSTWLIRVAFSEAFAEMNDQHEATENVV